MPVFRQTGQPLRQPRPHRLGIIRLGYKDTRQRADGSEYTFPRAADHFVLDDAPAVAEVYGDAPTVLEPVYLPVEDEEIMASHYLRYYTRTWGLTCRGDGLTAERWVDNEQLQATGEPVPASHETKQPVSMTVTCPCPLLEAGQCRETLFLRILLPDVPGIGLWQIGTGSINSIRNLQGSIAMIRAIAGRVTDVPLRLSLVPLTVTSANRGGQVTVHVLQLDLADQGTPRQLATVYREHAVGVLPPPVSGAYSNTPVLEVMGDPTEAPVEVWEPVAMEEAHAPGDPALKQAQMAVLEAVSHLGLTTEFMQLLIWNRYGVARMAELSLEQVGDLHTYLTEEHTDDSATVDITIPSADTPAPDSAPVEEAVITEATDGDSQPDAIEMSPIQEDQAFERVLAVGHDLGFAPEHVDIILGERLGIWLDEGNTAEDAIQALNDFHVKREKNRKPSA